MESESRCGVTDAHANEYFTGANHAESYEGHGYQRKAETQGRWKGMGFGERQIGLKSPSSCRKVQVKVAQQ